ncbi:hypothetical protein G6011_07102 [Alternaria panax]|uniref:Carboxylesterase type B domain-containing protein n=1 Tax=Alternaria panax TaxID=48097 RepID=A0AAD4I6T4_9PLEO|nr:hypothetical protein G6011_07102 [Alternaria panax]
MLNPTVFLLAASLAFPIDARRAQRRTEDSVPKLTLPWGTWEGQPYDEHGETTIFKNVRFGQAPVGDLRFSAPKYPEKIEDANQVQNSKYGPSCIEAVPKADVTFEPIGNGTTHAEDCLFLDVYVPSWAFDPDSGVNEDPLPVVVWIYGGAYIFGSKDLKFKLEDGDFQAYDGQGIRDAAEASGQGLIWVTGNYRMGAFGFLAGSTIEEEAQPNAGLHDQRLLLDWVQRYIGQVGGDKDSVSAWGLSAGAGSILHHLTAYGGRDNDKPLFQRAAMWSPAFQWGYDRTGALEETFRSFTEKAKCSSLHALECLRKASTDDLSKANQEIVSTALNLGMFPFGPAVDGDLVPELPAALLSKGQHNNCSSIIVSHDHDEVSLFLAKWVDTKEDFTQFLNYAFPGSALASIRHEIEEKYPARLFDFKQRKRMRSVLRDSTFVCNTRQIYNAFHNDSTVYTAKFEMPPAQHGFDMFAIIWKNGLRISDLVKKAAEKVPDFLLDFVDSIWVGFAPRFQRYYVGHALTGNPNYNKISNQPEWEPTVDDGNELTNSMGMGLYPGTRHPFFKSGKDAQSSTENCAFWDEVAKKISVLEKESTPFVSFREQLELR